MVGPVVMVFEVLVTSVVDPEPAPVLEELVTDVVNPELVPVTVDEAVLVAPEGLPAPLAVPVPEMELEPPSPTVHPAARF